MDAPNPENRLPVAGVALPGAGEPNVKGVEAGAVVVAAFGASVAVVVVLKRLL